MRLRTRGPMVPLQSLPVDAESTVCRILRLALHENQSNSTSSVYFLHEKMFIQTACVLPIAVTVPGQRQYQRERGSQFRNWDDAGGARPREDAKE